MEEKQRASNFWFGFFLGGLIGAFIIFILRTKEGKELAEKIREKGEFVEEDLEQKVKKLQKKGEDIVNQAIEVKKSLTRQVEEGREQASESVVSKMDEAFSKIADLQRKGVELTEEVHQKYFKKDGKPLTS